MVRDPRTRDDEEPDLGDVLDALHDPDCRRIITAIDEPMTANEISDATDVPLSTTYRKLDTLSAATLLLEGTEIRSDGRHTTRYEVDFEAVEVALEDHALECAISRPARTADEQIAALWREVRKET